jgi:molybdopterin-containing oxidoreductase family iron-sulfur binding subunit
MRGSIPILVGGSGLIALGIVAVTTSPFAGLWAAVAMVTIGVLLHGRKGRTPGAITPVSPPKDADAGVDAGRRSILRTLSLGAAGAAPLLVLSPMMDRLVSDVIRGGPGPERATAFTHDPEVPGSRRTRQWTMIIDLRACDGCQSNGTPPQCTAGCVEGHFAPEPMEWIEVYEEPMAGGGTHFIPAPCMQCQNPPCVNVCPVGATFSTPEGTVLIDQQRCIGCRICMAACPYDRRFFNWGDSPVPPEALLADYSAEHQTPAGRGTVMKCDFCPEMVRGGTLPFCIQACPNDAIYYGDLEEDIATNGRVIVKASHFLSEHHSIRLKEELGTDPRVYYVPGHGEDVGREPYNTGRMSTTWPWIERAEGATTWQR